MKRYILFSGISYYASGGFNDFTGTYDSLKDAIKAGETQPGTYYPEWYHVWDNELQTIVSHGEEAPYGGSENPQIVIDKVIAESK